MIMMLHKNCAKQEPNVLRHKVNTYVSYVSISIV